MERKDTASPAASDIDFPSDSEEFDKSCLVNEEMQTKTTAYVADVNTDRASSPSFVKQQIYSTVTPVSPVSETSALQSSPEFLTAANSTEPEEEKMEVVPEQEDAAQLDLSTEEETVVENEVLVENQTEGIFEDQTEMTEVLVENQTVENFEDQTEMSYSTDQAMDAETVEKEVEVLYSGSVEHEDDQALDRNSVDQNDQIPDSETLLAEQMENQVQDRDSEEYNDHKSEIDTWTEEHLNKCEDPDSTSKKELQEETDTWTEEQNECEVPDSASEKELQEETLDKEDSHMVEPQQCSPSAGNTATKSFIWEESTEAASHFRSSDVSRLPSSSRRLEQAGRAHSRSKTAVRMQKCSTQENKQTKSRKKKKRAATTPYKVSVPALMVTAPSDQSDNGSEDKLPATSTSPGVKRKFVSTNNLPPGWKRESVRRVGGKYAGKFDTVLYSDTNVKMRSYPNVQEYLAKTNQLHLLEDDSYYFKFTQPDEEGNVVPGKKPKSKSLPSRSVKASQNKITAPNPGGNSNSSLEPAIPTVPEGGKVLITLKRTDSPHGKPGWEIKNPPKGKKAAKRNSSGSRKELPPPLKLASLFGKKPSSSAKSSKVQSSFKTVLFNNPSAKKSDEAAAPRVDDCIITLPARVCEESLDDVKDTQLAAKEMKESSDEERLRDEGFYVPEEQEAVFESDNEEENSVLYGNNGDLPVEMENAGPEAIAEELVSENASVCEIRTDESDGESDRLGTCTEDIMGNQFRDVGQRLSESVMRIGKRSLSPSDSDISAHKRQRKERDTDVEDDSSHSLEMASDSSLHVQEDDENHNMARKVQKMHLSDSSSSKDMKDSASTCSSNSSSLPPTTLLSPSWTNRRSHIASSKGKVTAKKSLPVGNASSATSSCTENLTVRTNGATTSTSQEQKLHRDVKRELPRSPYNLIQESLSHDPWKLLVGTIFLREAEAGLAITKLWKFLNRWPEPEKLQGVETDCIAKILQPMKRSKACAATVSRFSEEYLTKNWLYPIELHGINKYGNDSYRIFCIEEWDQVKPDDDRLISFCRWMHNCREQVLE